MTTADVPASTEPPRRPYRPPPSVTLPALIPGGTDEEFRALIHGLLVSAARLTAIGEAFGRALGLTGPQYTILMATAHLQGEAGIGIRQLADHLHVAPSHVTTEVSKLVAKGVLVKRSNPDDRRGVLISVTRQGERAIEGLAPRLQEVNDVLFAGVTAAEFRSLRAFIERFVVTTERAAARIERREREPLPAERARSGRSGVSLRAGEEHSRC